MYAYNRYSKYIEHYVLKAKSIFFESYSCHWNTETGQFDFKNHIHYGMFFNSAGRLQEVLIPKNSWKNGNIEKTTFLYNNRNKLIYLITSKFRAQIFISSINIHYDSRGRIDFEVIECDESGIDKYCFHEFENDFHTVTCSDDDDDTVNYIIKEKLDAKGKIIEHRRLKYGEYIELFEKYIYSNNGDLLFTFLLNEDNIVLTETQYFENRITTIDRRKLNSISIDEIQTQYNNKGHWVKKCTIRNGELKFIEERAINYYD